MRPHPRTLLVEARWRLAQGDNLLARQQLAEVETRFDALNLVGEAREARDLHAQIADPARTA